MLTAQQFSRCMAKLMASVPFDQLVAFLDDLLLASDDVQTHLQRLEWVLKMFSDANMKLTPGKCHFLQHEVKYVGLHISQDGLRITDERVEAVKVLQRPRTVKETQSVLGFLNYNRKFVENFSATAKPLYSLLNKDHRSHFDWTTDCEDSFEKLKEDICRGITLSIPDIEDPLNSYQVKLDASKTVSNGLM